MIANAKIETVYIHRIFFKKRYSFFDKSVFEYNFIAMDKQEAIQNKKRIRRERRQERNRQGLWKQRVSGCPNTRTFWTAGVLYKQDTRNILENFSFSVLCR